MAFIVKNDLSKFSEKLKNYRKQGDLAQKVADKVAEKGAEIAQKNWESGVIISIKGDKTQKSIVATDVNIEKPTLAYREFGTGIQGEGKYEGELPKQNITFTDSKGEVWTTQGWQYAYRNKQQPEKYPEPFKGQAPKMPMFNTAKELREYIRVDLAQDIRKGD